MFYCAGAAFTDGAACIPQLNLAYGNAYATVPVNDWRNASIILTIIHHFVAYALCMTPVFSMWEKSVRTHDKPLWIRLSSRLPVALFVDFISLLLPFFDIGFIQKGFVYSFTAFAFPAAAYLWVYRTSAARASSPKKPGFVGGCPVAFAICTFILDWFLVFGVGFGVWAAIKQLVDVVNQLVVFAPYYQCAAIPKTTKLQG